VNPRLLIIGYLILDWVAAAGSWTILYAFRKLRLEPEVFGSTVELVWTPRFVQGLLLVPLFWIALYALAGMYARPLKRHRILEVGQVLWTTLLGGVILFFALLIDDTIGRYQHYYASLAVLCGSHFVLTLTGRMAVTTRTVRRIHKGIWAFPTLVVGGNGRALAMVHEMESLRKKPGFRFVGYVQANGKDTDLTSLMPRLGHVSDLRQVISDHKIEEVIIAISSGDHAILETILNEVEGTGVAVRISPDIYDILSGSVRMSSIYGAPLMEIDQRLMPQWQWVIKRAMDWIASVLALILLAPVFLVIALLVWFTSSGGAFYRQERIGLHGKPFQIIKFRTMYEDAEARGPQLSSEDDPRITPVGRFLRKSRFDELPQFYNVLRGDMALVGPRPERAHFIEKITERAPHYRHLSKVRPGITSWGQVKYGYAENVDQMIARLRFDLIYIENMSIALDLKILAYTVLTVLKGRGK
jgi:exopolysaccharide biosynthesis polyprenyl glycosylphosphotransferase